MSERDIFTAARELTDPAARSAYLDGACGGDAGLRERVEALLRAHDQPDSLLDHPALAAHGPDPEATCTLVRENGDGSDDEVPLGFLAPPTRPDSLGRIGHYEVLQVLGQGGFGIVFRAFDEVLHRIVAVKVLSPQMAATSPARKRFLREARSSAQVRHENVVQVYEVGEQPLPYIAMEFIPGETLQQRLDRVGPIEPAEVVRIGRQIAEGLAAAHATDLIHRDIKPGNILLESGAGRVKITDFGLARAADDASISQSGIIAGTPMYMAPEQAKGEKLDQRADLFSLGSVLYQMASGRPPFRANSTLAVLKRVAEDTPRDIREIIPETPQWLCDVIAKLHAKNPDDRFQSAREVADVLADCEAQLKEHAKLEDSSRIRRVTSVRPGRHKWAVAVVVLSLLTLVITEVVGVTHLFRTRPGTQHSDGTDDGVESRDPGNGRGAPAHASAPAADRDFALEFDGKTAHVVVPSLRFRSDQPLTVEVQVKFKQAPTPGAGVIASAYDPDSAMSLVRGWEDVPEFFARRELDFKVAGTKGKLGNNVWMHLAGVWDGTDSRLYVNGKKHPIVSLPRSVAAKHTVRLNQPLVLGADCPTGAQPGRFLHGSLDEIRLSKIARYGQDFDPPTLGARFQPDEHTLALFHCDEGTGRVLKDSSNNAHHGQLVGAKWVEVDGSPIASLPVDPPRPVASPFRNGIGMEFVRVPKGKSWLGGGKGKLGDKEVEIPADFYLGKYEVTQEEWEKVMGENPSHFSRTGGGKDAVKDIPEADLKRFPVEEVSWDQCQLFVAKLNRLEKELGWNYRLPNEVEWEYACRGGPMAEKVDGAFDFYFAKPTDALLPNLANYNTGTLEDPTGLKRTCRVGSYEPNVLGLCDMHGNAWEWCEDTEKANRLLRGGCWYFEAEYCRAARSDTRPPSTRHKSLGLRLARVPSGAASPEAKTTAVRPFTDADVQRIAALPAAEQVEEVRKELVRRNPGFDGTMQHKIEGGVVTAFAVVTDQVTDIAPIRAFGCLRVLKCNGTFNNGPRGVLADLTTLKGMNLAALTELDLRWTKVTDAGMVYFKDCKDLRQVHLSTTPVTDVGLAHFKDCKNLAVLNLGGTRVTDAGLAHFTDCRDLQKLALGLTRVTNAGLAHFKDCKNLTELVLSETQVTEAGLAHFKDCKELTRLYIGKTKFTDLSLLKGMPLKELYCDFQPERDGEILRSIKTLEKINGRPTAEFWKDAEKK